MRCSRCSSALEEMDSFCSTCGEPILAKEPPDPLLGQRLQNEYLVQRRLGRGGFGAVYEAEQPSMRRKVAIKTLHPHLLHHAQIVARFYREGMAASQLSHPAAIKVFQSGRTTEGIPWLAMEFVQGETLEDYIQRQGPLPVEAFLSIIGPISEVLQEAHQKGIIHRDLKPENIMLLSSGGRLFPKLLDFGIAGLLEESARLTQTGVVSGTPMYMSPEQWRSMKHADARSDLYALGLISYYCLSGRLPFEAMSVPEWMQRHCMEEPRALHLAVLVSRAVSAVIMRTLAKDPSARYPSVAAFYEALQRAASGAAAEPLPQINSRYTLRFISGKYSGAEYPLREGREIRLGRADELEVVLVDDMVSPRHAKLSLQNGECLLEDLGSTNGTFVNGTKIKRALLQEGDQILIGTSIIKLLPASQAEHHSAQRSSVVWGAALRIDVFRGSTLLQQQTFTPQNPIIKIGRMQNANLSLEGEGVSRMHAAIDLSADKVSIMDLGSAGGTWVNGQKIAKLTLSDQDEISIGDLRLVVHFL